MKELQKVKRKEETSKPESNLKKAKEKRKEKRKEMTVKEEIETAQQKITGKKDKSEEKEKKEPEERADKSKEISFLEQKLKEEKDLEETLIREAAAVHLEILHSKYTLQLSHKPVEELQQEIADLNQAVDDKGYISWEEEKKVEYILGAMEKKLEAVQEGDYSFTEETALAANLTQQIGAQLRDLYQQNKKQRDLYHSE